MLVHHQHFMRLPLQFAVYLYSRVKRGTMWVKSVSQKRNTLNGAWPLDSLTDRPLCFPYVQVCLRTRQKPKTRIAYYEQGGPGLFLHAANIISNFLRRKKVRSQLLFLYFCCTFADENLAKSYQICEIVPLDLSVRCLKLLVFFPFVSSSGIFFMAHLPLP